VNLRLLRKILLGLLALLLPAAPAPSPAVSHAAARRQGSKPLGRSFQSESRFKNIRGEP